MLSNKKRNLIVTDLFIRGRKMFFCFYYTILFCCSKKYWIKFYTLVYYENSNKREHQQIAFKHSSDTDFQDFMNLYKKCTAKANCF